MRTTSIVRKYIRLVGRGHLAPLWYSRVCNWTTAMIVGKNGDARLIRQNWDRVKVSFRTVDSPQWADIGYLNPKVSSAVFCGVVHYPMLDAGSTKNRPEWYVTLQRMRSRYL